MPPMVYMSTAGSPRAVITPLNAPLALKKLLQESVIIYEGIINGSITKNSMIPLRFMLL